MTWNRNNDFVGRETLRTFERGTRAKAMHLASRPTILHLMLTGKNPLHLPAYSGALPAVVTITCDCRRRYVVLTGVADAGAHLVRREAERRGAIFVDARVEPFVMCDCGQALDLSNCEAPAAVM